MAPIGFVAPKALEEWPDMQILMSLFVGASFEQVFQH